MSDGKNYMAWAAMAALLSGAPPSERAAAAAKRNRKSAHYTKSGPGRRHRSGKPRQPFLGVAETIKPERAKLYMHSAARKRAELSA